MTTLSKEKLEECLKRESDPLVVTPLLRKEQIGSSSIDLRLSNQFIVFRSHRFGVFQPLTKASEEKEDPRTFQERQILRFGDRFILHPGVLILGCTFEYVSMPLDLEGQVEGRSSWARLGLQIATASNVEPGFKGVITFELSNVGTVPLTLMPGIRVAQMVFRVCDPPLSEAYSKERKYYYPIGPEFSHIYKDSDWKTLLHW